ADATDTRSMEHMVDELVNGLTNFEVTVADRILGEAFTIYPFEDVLLNLVQPALIEAGERWHRGEINVAAEHFSTEYLRRKIASFLNVFENNPQRETIVIGCAPMELHDVGVLLSSVFLVRRGWHVVYLGAQVPEADLLQTVQAMKPALVCLSATTRETAHHLAACAHALQEQFPHVRFGYGGRIFNQHPELRDEVPGIFLGQDARTFAERVAQLLARGSTSVISKAS
ncbi:MAG TPA: cobalamin-dependent protein, partial [Roseiflexaceae bacterium]|nr:cobalamin-dependent protein [Roseiflexaceae bacterium]